MAEVGLGVDHAGYLDNLDARQIVDHRLGDRQQFCNPTLRTAAYPSSTGVSWLIRPATREPSPLRGTWPDRYSMLPTRLTGRCCANGSGAGGRTSPSASSFCSGVVFTPCYRGSRSTRVSPDTRVLAPLRGRDADFQTGQRRLECPRSARIDACAGCYRKPLIGRRGHSGAGAAARWQPAVVRCVMSPNRPARGAASVMKRYPGSLYGGACAVDSRRWRCAPWHRPPGSGPAPP